MGNWMYDYVCIGDTFCVGR